MCKKFKKENTNGKIKTIIIATKRFFIAEHFIINIGCANNYKLSNFRVVNHCSNLNDLERLKVIFIYLYE